MGPTRLPSQGVGPAHTIRPDLRQASLLTVFARPLEKGSSLKPVRPAALERLRGVKINQFDHRKISNMELTLERKRLRKPNLKSRNQPDVYGNRTRSVQPLLCLLSQDTKTLIEAIEKNIHVSFGTCRFHSSLILFLVLHKRKSGATDSNKTSGPNKSVFNIEVNKLPNFFFYAFVWKCTALLCQ
ncbi:Protein of unknown function [Gryllus bimaculatus]|nr:Protein of unknown function [Gryllus bimaculatus]